MKDLGTQSLLMSFYYIAKANYGILHNKKKGNATRRSFSYNTFDR